MPSISEPLVPQPRNLDDGKWSEKNQSAPGFTLTVDVTADNLGEWLTRNQKTLSPAAAAEMLEQINEATEDNDLTRTDLFRQLYAADNGHSEQDLRDYENTLLVLRGEGYGLLADGAERYVAGLRSRSTLVPAAPAVPALPDGHFLLTDPRVQAGEAVPVIVMEDGSALHLAGDDVLPRAPRVIRVLANRQLTDDEAAQFGELVDYAYRVAAHKHSRAVHTTERDTPYSFYVEVTAYDFSGAWFTQNLTQYVEHGTPERVTDREGDGTSGTRLAEGFGADMFFDLYYDRVANA